MEPQNPESNPAPQVPVEIPSAVRSGNSWNTLMLLGFAVAGLLIVFLLKGGNRKTSVPVGEAMTPMTENAVPASPMPSLAAVETKIPSANLQNSDAESLRDVRRRSPILIYNNTASSDNDGSAPSPTESGLPLPPGFHPTTAASSHSTALGDREFIIAQGKLIDAVLETAINTDHPGMLRALVSNDIYGDTGRTVLLPRGSRLIGQYDSDVSQGQSRVFIIWQRVIRPDGIDMKLDSGGTDALGQAGLNGKVNHHFFTMFGAATLLSMIGATAATVGVSPQDNNNSLSGYRSSVSQGFSEAANTVLGVFVRIKPTVTVHQGTAIKVFVARDLYFDPAAVATHRVQVIP